MFVYNETLPTTIFHQTTLYITFRVSESNHPTKSAKTTALITQMNKRPNEQARNIPQFACVIRTVSFIRKHCIIGSAWGGVV